MARLKRVGAEALKEELNIDRFRQDTLAALEMLRVLYFRLGEDEEIKAVVDDIQAVSTEVKEAIESPLFYEGCVAYFTTTTRVLGAEFSLNEVRDLMADYSSIVLGDDGKPYLKLDWKRMAHLYNFGKKSFQDLIEALHSIGHVDENGVWLLPPQRTPLLDDMLRSYRPLTMAALRPDRKLPKTEG